ncbi:hypothetical protein C6990_09695 [Nitrosopumilus sp. b3]|uniref:hypothetical protein n=1 Tax=Nitrosopumilus sp. b3 TaxID=2109909 RepID=UPI0015F737A5|nr:hypothetical protein [Nitrosopumilus sp. b3]KAF6246386.1 hypothetical protein C6990_09695 [Nitrosopumilus sp. b3]
MKNTLAASKASYTISPLSEGYIGKCDINPEISVYGKTSEDALEKIKGAITEYEKVFKKAAK